MYQSYAKNMVCRNGHCKEIESIRYTNPQGKIMNNSNQREITLPSINTLSTDWGASKVTPFVSPFLLQTPNVFQNNRNRFKV